MKYCPINYEIFFPRKFVCICDLEITRKILLRIWCANLKYHSDLSKHNQMRLIYMWCGARDLFFLFFLGSSRFGESTLVVFEFFLSSDGDLVLIHNMLMLRSMYEGRYLVLGKHHVTLQKFWKLFFFSYFSKLKQKIERKWKKSLNVFIRKNLLSGGKNWNWCWTWNILVVKNC